jgi:hypothetical protein
MKRAIMIIGLALLGLTSCQKENLHPIQPTGTDCECGVITSTNFTAEGWQSRVKNNCTLNDTILYYNAGSMEEYECLNTEW